MRICWLLGTNISSQKSQSLWILDGKFDTPRTNISIIYIYIYTYIPRYQLIFLSELGLHQSSHLTTWWVDACQRLTSTKLTMVVSSTTERIFFIHTPSIWFGALMGGCRFTLKEPAVIKVVFLILMIWEPEIPENWMLGFGEPQLWRLRTTPPDNRRGSDVLILDLITAQHLSFTPSPSFV